MLDRLPSSLQHHVLLEWLSPSAVIVIACAGSSSLRAAVLTAPCAFRAAQGEILKDTCVRWFRRREIKLVLWTTVVTGCGVSIRECNGKVHCDGDLPAAVHIDGTQMWYQWGKLHRDGDLPAVIDAHGVRAWYQHGKVHRDGDGPALTDTEGTQKWYKHGMQHREDDMPAVVYADGTLEWWWNGHIHRLNEDLPAVIWVDGTREWWQNGTIMRSESSHPPRADDDNDDEE